MGATVGKIMAEGIAMSGGFGIAQINNVASGLTITAVVVVNCLGDIVDATGTIIAGARQANGEIGNGVQALYSGNFPSRQANPLQLNSTLVAVICNARFDKAALMRIAKMASCGMARAIVPVFTTYDGDIVFTISQGNLNADEVVVGALAAEAVRLAIIQAVKV